MATTRHKAYTAAIATAHSTTLNSLANNANSAASSTIDNSTTLDLFHDLTLTVAAQGVARSAGATVGVYLIMALDGTNFDAVNEVTGELVGVFHLDASTTGRQLTRRDVPIPPGLFQYFVRNQTGQAFAASGSILEYRAHSLESV